MRTPTLYLDDDSEVQLPIKWQICGRCDGHGKSSAYLGAFTSDDWAEQDDEWKDDYIAGHFDRPCETCGGSGKIAIADRSQMSKEHRALYDAQQRELAEMRAIERAERMAEGTWDE